MSFSRSYVSSACALVAALSIAALSACGGGGSDASVVAAATPAPAPVTATPVPSAPVTSTPVTTTSVTPAPVTPAPVTPAPVTPAPVAAVATVSGTAATGAAIAGGAVSMNCVSGPSASATSAADGSYSLNATGVTFPCVARVSYGTEKLHSFVSGTGTANITPVTELLVANLTGGIAADAFDKFDATKNKALTLDQVKAAIATVKTYLAGLGVSVADFPADPIGTKLVAKTAAADGDKFDKVLDDLQAKLKAGNKKLSDAVTEVNGSKPAAPITPTAIVTPVPGGTQISSGSATAGPSLDKTKLAVLCPTLVTGETDVYSKCKAASNGSTNSVLIDVNVWLNTYAKNLKVVSVDSGLGLGLAVGDSCEFFFEPGLGLWFASFKTNTVYPNPGIGFTGAANDKIQLYKGTQVSQMSAGDAFSSAKGAMELNFPVAPFTTSTELVYGKNGNFVRCAPSK